MCLIAFAVRAHAAYPLAVAANRDEFRGRPTAPAAFWDDAPDVLAGRDLREGGTWMGVTRGGRFAAVTNYRELPPLPGLRSRGELVSAFLRGADAAEAYARAVEASGDAYNGFNLVVRDGDAAWYVSNRGDGARPLAPGVYGLSNHLLDTPWPKVVRARRAMADALAAADGGEGWDAALWAMLADRVAAADGDLPRTGVGEERERLLSPPFIAGPEYGTRSSTVMTIGADGEVRFVERTVSDDGAWTEARHAFRIVR